VPTDAEWTILTDYLGGTSVAGGKLKETGTAHWISPNTGATNETGFTALPGGGRWGGTFNYNESYGEWWSATEYDATNAWHRYVQNNYSDVNNGNYDIYDKSLGFSVRCIKDN
jgi:uncharacterized protein (TIGR02145 family)